MQLEGGMTPAPTPKSKEQVKQELQSRVEKEVSQPEVKSFEKCRCSCCARTEVRAQGEGQAGGVSATIEACQNRSFGVLEECEKREWRACWGIRRLQLRWRNFTAWNCSAFGSCGYWSHRNGIGWFGFVRGDDRRCGAAPLPPGMEQSTRPWRNPFSTSPTNLQGAQRPRKCCTIRVSGWSRGLWNGKRCGGPLLGSAAEEDGVPIVPRSWQKAWAHLRPWTPHFKPYERACECQWEGHIPADGGPQFGGAIWKTRICCLTLFEHRSWSWERNITCLLTNSTQNLAMFNKVSKLCVEFVSKHVMFLSQLFHDLCSKRVVINSFVWGKCQSDKLVHEYMAQDGSWGDECTLECAAHLFQRPIQVICPDPEHDRLFLPLESAPDDSLDADLVLAFVACETWNTLWIWMGYILYPIGSMVLVYLSTWLGDF